MNTKACRGRFFVPRKGFVVCSLSVAALLLGPGAMTALQAESSATSGAAVRQTGENSVSFFTDKARLWTGRPQIICFQLAQPATEDRFFSFQIDENFAHLLIPPQVLKGEKIGYLRVQPLAEGKTQLVIGGTKIDLDITRDADTDYMAELHPQIVAPASGAVVWGPFDVGVEQLSMGDPSQLQMPTLRLANGREVTGHPVPDQKISPHGRWVYTLDSADLAPGANKLVAVSTDANGRQFESVPVYVDVVRPTPEMMVSGSCTTNLNDDRTATDGNPPPVVNDDKYKQGKVVNDSGAAWCLPVWAKEKGLYQLMVTARGDMAGDGLGTVGIDIDERIGSETMSRLATTEWQHMPVGHPFALDAGGHILRVSNRNPFAMGEAPGDVRTLFLQKYELVRLTPSAPTLAAKGGGDMMMAGDAMAGAAAAPSMAMQMPAAPAAPTAAAGSSPMAAQAGNPMMAMSGGSSGNAAAEMEALHVTFLDNIDGEMVAGPVTVRLKPWWPTAPATPPRVELFINKQLVGTQVAPYASFNVDTSAFKIGPNVVEARAILSSGASASSAPFTLNVPDDFPLPRHKFKPTISYSVYNSGLACTMTPPPPSPGDPNLANFTKNAQSTITLPDDLAGKYLIVLGARGQEFEGPPILRIALKSGGQETKIAEVPVAAKPGHLNAGVLDLQAGPKQLTFALTNGAAADGKGSRSLYIRTVHLVPSYDDANTPKPVVAIAVAPKTISAGNVDAVVARVLDNRTLTGADLMIDGQPQHLDEIPAYGVGLMTFPVLTRDLKPGLHHLKVVATDYTGIQAESPTVAFTISDQPQPELSKYERALFLLNRFGYGPEPREIAAILTMGEEKWLESRLSQSATSPAEENEQVALKAGFPNRHDVGDVTRGAIDYLLTDPNPVRARFVMWAENHFSTWITKDLPHPKEAEHRSFMDLGPVPFFDLLFTSATSPAMLYYLDQLHSYSHALNENYAREIMELHTLGVNGGYTQKDVTTLADLLTGWTLCYEGAHDGSGGVEIDRFFGYDPELNSGTACKIFGVEFPGVEPEKRFDRVLMALELLTAHPSCAHFISRKLCEHYVADPAPPKLVDDLAKVYLETGGDMRAMLLAMSQHPDFWAASGKLANPIDFGIRTERMAHIAKPSPVSQLIFASGMGMFDRATPDGYPEDNGYSANSNALLQRWRFAKDVGGDFISGGLIPDSLKPTDNGWDAGTMQRIVDLAAVRMTGNVLSPSSNEAAQKLLSSSPANTDLRLNTLATFICQLPENSLK